MISVIVPVYNGAANGAELLRECLDSILAQSGTTFELIVVNDGSTDGTAAVLAEYARCNPAMRVLEKTNGGVSSARNLGVREAQEDYVCFVDADDRLLPDALLTFSTALRRTKAPVVIGRATNNALPTKNYGDFSIREYDAVDYAARTLYQRGGHNSPWAMLVSRNLLIDEPFDESMRYEDLELSCRLYLRACAVAVIDAPVYFYRYNPASFINSWSPSRADSLKATAAIENFVRRTEPSLLKAARDRRLSANFNVFILASLNRAGDTIAPQCWRLIKDYRRASLFNRRVRIKNKIGIILSYFGPRVLLWVGRQIMKN